jgi:hypothetical protein
MHLLEMYWYPCLNPLINKNRRAVGRDSEAYRAVCDGSITFGANGYRLLRPTRLLKDDCAGNAGLDDDLRARLRKLAEAPESQPPAAAQPDSQRKAPSSR